VRAFDQASGGPRGGGAEKALTRPLGRGSKGLRGFQEKGSQGGGSRRIGVVMFPRLPSFTSKKKKKKKKKNNRLQQQRSSGEGFPAQYV